MTNTYQLLKQLEELPYFNELLQKGIVPTNVYDYKTIYEHYLSELDILLNMKTKVGNVYSQANTNTADEYGISERTVYRIVERMESI